MKHTDRPLQDKINQVIDFCKKFPIGKKKYYQQAYNTNYGSEDGNITEWISGCIGGLIIVGTYDRNEIIEKFIDYFGLYEENQKDGTTRL